MEGQLPHTTGPGDPIAEPPTHHGHQSQPGRTIDFSHKTQPQEEQHNNSITGAIAVRSHYATGSQSAPITLQVRTIQIPKSMKNAAFLRHPDLTMGQKRYLCSIAKIYSTSSLKANIDRHLQSQKRCGLNTAGSSCRSSGKALSGTKEHSIKIRRIQINHNSELQKEPFIYESKDGKPDNEDKGPNTATTAPTIEDSMSQQIKSLSVKDANGYI